MARDVVDSARFDLRGPRDLLDKLDFDRGRFNSAKTKAEAVYITFDCAVDAWSMVDWYHEYLLQTDKAIKREYAESALLEAVPNLAACRLIATSAKHFVVRRGPKSPIDTRISTLYSKTVENGAVVRKPDIQLPFLMWEGESYDCDDFFADVWLGLKLFLDRHGITDRNEWIHYAWSDDT